MKNILLITISFFLSISPSLSQEKEILKLSINFNSTTKELKLNLKNTLSTHQIIQRQNVEAAARRGPIVGYVYDKSGNELKVFDTIYTLNDLPFIKYDPLESKTFFYDLSFLKKSIPEQYDKIRKIKLLIKLAYYPWKMEEPFPRYSYIKEFDLKW